MEHSVFYIAISAIGILLAAVVSYLYAQKKYGASRTDIKKAEIGTEESKDKQKEKLASIQKEFEKNKHDLRNVQTDLDKAKDTLTQFAIQVESLEDELDDSEYKSKRLNRQLNSQKEELVKTRKELETYKDDLTKKSKELEGTQITLDDTKVDLKEKEGSLNFVREILDAQNANNKDIVEFNKKIDRIVTFIEDELLSLFKPSEENASDFQFNKTTLWQWANLQKKTWIQGKRVVAFVGEFSAGKTTIVNRILSQDNADAPKLPVSSKATTAIATYISYGVDFNSQFTTPLGKLKNVSKQTFESINKEVLEHINVSSLIHHFVITYKNDNLKDLSILDTPGFNSNDSQDAKRTTEVIKEADVLFWVLDANAGEINKTSLNIIQKNLEGIPLYIIINKSDTKSQGELEELKAHIATTINTHNLNVAGYICFSQNEPVDTLLEIIKNSPVNMTTKSTFIEDLYYRLRSSAATSRSLYFNIKKDIGKKTDNYDEKLEEFDSTCKDIEYNCKDIKDTPQNSTSWFGFGSESYKMDSEEFNKFTDALDDIIRQMNNLNTVQQELIEAKEQVTKAKIALSKSKAEKIRNEELLNKFEKHLRDWDPTFISDNNL